MSDRTDTAQTENRDRGWPERRSGVRRVRRQRVRETLVYEKPRCAGCGEELVPVSDSIVGEDGTWDALWAKGGMVVAFRGGYGMAVDPIDEVDNDGLTAVLCGSCVDEMRDKLDWVRRILDPYLERPHN